MIATAQLDLVPATVALTRAALEGNSALGAALKVAVPASWPPEHYDTQALELTLAQLSRGAAQEGWWLHFFVQRAERILIGSGGFKGPPSADGTVEVGYSVVSDHQQRGYGSEAVRGLVSHAFAVSSVRRVYAHTLPGLEPSIRLLKKCGFELMGDGTEPGAMRYELTRP